MAGKSIAIVYEQTSKDLTAKSKGLRWLSAQMEHQTDDCQEWPFYRSEKGYGRLTIGGHRLRTHRLVCYWAFGTPPIEGMHAAHSCGNPACVNKKHLRWASLHENEQDKSGYMTLPGSQHWCAKIDEASVSEVRRLIASGRHHKVVAEETGVSIFSVRDIAKGKTWAWLK